MIDLENADEAEINRALLMVQHAFPEIRWFVRAPSDKRGWSIRCFIDSEGIALLKPANKKAIILGKRPAMTGVDWFEVLLRGYDPQELLKYKQSMRLPTSTPSPGISTMRQMLVGDEFKRMMGELLQDQFKQFELLERRVKQEAEEGFEEKLNRALFGPQGIPEQKQGLANFVQHLAEQMSRREEDKRNANQEKLMGSIKEALGKQGAEQKKDRAHLLSEIKKYNQQLHQEEMAMLDKLSQQQRICIDEVLNQLDVQQADQIKALENIVQVTLWGRDVDEETISKGFYSCQQAFVQEYKNYLDQTSAQLEHQLAKYVIDQLEEEREAFGQQVETKVRQLGEQFTTKQDQLHQQYLEQTKKLLTDNHEELKKLFESIDERLKKLEEEESELADKLQEQLEGLFGANDAKSEGTGSVEKWKNSLLDEIKSQSQANISAMQEQIMQGLIGSMQQTMTGGIESFLSAAGSKLLSQQSVMQQALYASVGQLLGSHQNDLKKFMERQDAQAKQHTSVMERMTEQLEKQSHQLLVQGLRSHQVLELLDAVLAQQVEMAEMDKYEQKQLRCALEQRLESFEGEQLHDHQQLIVMLQEVLEQQQTMGNLLDTMMMFDAESVAEESGTSATPKVFDNPRIQTFYHVVVDQIERTYHISLATLNKEIQADAGKYGHAGTAIKAAGKIIPIPFAPLITSLMGSALEATGKHKHKKFAKRVVNCFATAKREFDQDLIQEAASQIAKDYEKQLSQLDSDSVVKAAKYVVTGILGEVILLEKDKEKSSRQEKLACFNHSVRACGRVKLSSKLSQVILERELSGEDKGKKWRAHGLFGKSGIKVAEHNYVLASDVSGKKHKFRKAKQPRYQKYGFHEGTEEEAAKSKFIKLSM